MTSILIVDAEEAWRELFKERFEQDGFRVLTAGNGREALRVLEDAVPEVVVTEARLPGMDGLDLMARILDRYPRVHVVLHSACTSYLDSFLSWAADACLPKTPDTGELNRTVRRLLAPEAPTGLPTMSRSATTAPRASS